MYTQLTHARALAQQSRTPSTTDQPTIIAAPFAFARPLISACADDVGREAVAHQAFSVVYVCANECGW